MHILTKIDIYVIFIVLFKRNVIGLFRIANTHLVVVVNPCSLRKVGYPIISFWFAFALDNLLMFR